MKIRYLRLIDSFFGIIFCFLFLIQKNLCGLNNSHKKNNSGNKSVNKILIIKFFGFGSIVLAFDLFSLLRKEFPQAEIYALTLKENKPIYESTGIFDEIIDLRLNTLFSFFFDTLKAIIRLKRLSFDIVFDLEFTSRFSALLTYIIHGKRRIGFAYSGVWRGDCFTDTLKFREDILLKDSLLKLSAFVAPDAGFSIDPLQLRIKEEESVIIKYFLRENNLELASPIIGMNINASDLSLLRRWPRENFIALAKDLIRRYSARIVFVGSADDVAYVEEAIEEMGRQEYIYNLTGKITLLQLASLCASLRLFISNDSGPLHLAAYLGVPTISFFGPETPLIYGPEGRSDTVFYKKIPCSPCIRVKNYKHSRCIYDQRCLKQITVSEVLDAIQRKGILR